MIQENCAIDTFTNSKSIVESSYLSNLIDSQNNLRLIGKNSNDKKNEVFTLKGIYFEIREKFENYARENFSHTYSTSVINHLAKIFVENEVQTLTEMRNLINGGKIHQKNGSLAIRVLLNYCEEHELMELDELDVYRRRIKIKSVEHVDNFIPKDEQVFYSINKLHEMVDKKHLLIYRFMLETSCRYTEAVDFFDKFDKQKLEIKDGVCSYSNFYKKGKKTNFYLMFTEDLYNELKPHLKNIKKSDMIYVKRKAQREKELICLKYLRKVCFSIMVRNGIPIEIANLISGRSQKSNVGITHYLDKQQIMFSEYQKIIPSLNELTTLQT